MDEPDTKLVFKEIKRRSGMLPENKILMHRFTCHINRVVVKFLPSMNG